MRSSEYLACGPGFASETWEATRLAVEQTFNVTGSVNEMDDLDPIASRQIENQPVFETFHRPAAEAAEGWMAKGAKGAEPGAGGPGLKRDSIKVLVPPVPRTWGPGRGSHTADCASTR